MTYVLTDECCLYTLINKDGIIIEGLKATGIYDLALMDGEKTFVVNDKAFSLTLDEDYPQKLILGLIATESDFNGL